MHGLVRVPRVSLLAITLTAGCSGISALDHTSEDSCTKLSCGYDRAFIGGNLDVAIDTPMRVRVDRCVDDVCEDPIELEPGPWIGSNVLMRGRHCPPELFECLDTRRWWIGWAPSVFADDGELVRSY